MKASKFSDAQKAFNLKQRDDGIPVAAVCRKGGIDGSRRYARRVSGQESAYPDDR